MSDEGGEELTRGEDFASFERRMMSLFDRMAARIDAEAEESRRRDGKEAEESRRRDEALERQAEALERQAEALDRQVEALKRRAEVNEQKAEQWEKRVQRQIEFLARQQGESQAKAEADMQRLRELHEQNEGKWARTSDGINALLAIAEMHQREFLEMRQAQAEAQARADAQVAEARARADAKSAETDERLNALINTVERIISERRNGGRKEPGGEDE